MAYQNRPGPTLFSLQVTVIHAITPVVRSKVGMIGLHHSKRSLFSSQVCTRITHIYLIPFTRNPRIRPSSLEGVSLP